MAETGQKSATARQTRASRFDGERQLEKVIPIRLSGEKWEQIKTESKELGVSASTLARMWILDGLRRHHNALEPGQRLKQTPCRGAPAGGNNGYK